VTTTIWHDLECGSYLEDINLWRSLAGRCGSPILDVGAGTGRVTLDLAGLGYEVTALDRDPILLAELARRAEGLSVTTAAADAREFDLGRRFALCLVPMQTIQLLGGPAGRAQFLRCARVHLAQRGLVAIAISEALDVYEVSDGTPAPLPDMRELDGVVYASHPTAVRAQDDGFVLERRRETISASGERRVEHDTVHLDRLTASQLEHEARAAALTPAGRAMIPANDDYVGSTVVMLSA
jgi:SAM-dependent methyltransferase